MEIFRHSFKSGYFTRQNIEGLIDVILEIAKEDNKRQSYKHKPEFSFSLLNGYKYVDDDKKSFVKQLEDSKINLLNSFNLEYFGNNTRFRLEYRKIFSEEIEFSYETKNKKDYPYIKEKISDLIGQGNINNFFHDYKNIFYIFIILSLIIYSLYSELFFALLKSYILFWIPFILFFLFTALVKIYPRLIIEFDKKMYGRNLKKDLWWIVIIIIIPIILQKIF